MKQEENFIKNKLAFTKLVQRMSEQKVGIWCRFVHHTKNNIMLLLQILLNDKQQYWRISLNVKFLNSIIFTYFFLSFAISFLVVNSVVRFNFIRNTYEVKTHSIIYRNWNLLQGNGNKISTFSKQKPEHHSRRSKNNIKFTNFLNKQEYFEQIFTIFFYAQH